MSVEQQKYHLDLTINFAHDYDPKVKAYSAPPTSSASRFEMRRVERVEHLTLKQCSDLIAQINELLDRFEKDVEGAS